MTTWHRDRAIITNYTEQFLRDMLLVTHRLSRWCCHNMLWSGVKYLDTIIFGILHLWGLNTSNQFPLLSMITTLDITNIPQIMTSITAVMPGVSIDQLVTAPAISLIWLRVDILGFPWQPWHHPDITSGRIIREHCEVSPWQCRSLNGGEEKSSELYQSMRWESSSYFVGIK